MAASGDDSISALQRMPFLPETCENQGLRLRPPAKSGSRATQYSLS